MLGQSPQALLGGAQLSSSCPSGHLTGIIRPWAGASARGPRPTASAPRGGRLSGLSRSQGRGTKHYGLIVVGHSLGAGTAAILSFLLRPQYPTLKCFAYSPPGGLLR